MNLSETLVKLDHDDLCTIAEARSKKDHRLLNAADAKARGELIQQGDKTWLDYVRGNVNAAHRAMRNAGGIDLVVMQTVFAAVEEATVGAIAKDYLTEAEYELLVTPVAKVCAPWLLDPSVAPPEPVEVSGPPVAAPAAATGPTTRKSASQRSQDRMRARREASPIEVPAKELESLVEAQNATDAAVVSQAVEDAQRPAEPDLDELLGDLLGGDDDPFGLTAPAPAPARKPSLIGRRR